ncbi:MAG: AAA family ATPase [Chloroflexi bacterium]|nr:AAA family ATPase [Chloroflexota bacterium]
MTVATMLATILISYMITFQVRYTETVVITTFGRPSEPVTEPGVRMKWPWPIQRVVRYDKRERILEGVEEAHAEFVSTFPQQLQRCFGTEVQGLNRHSDQTSGMEISMAQDDPPWNLTVSSQDSKLHTLDSHFDLSRQPIQIERLLVSSYNRRLTSRQRRNIPKYVGSPEFMIDRMLEEIIHNLYAGINIPAYYLPAARSGILQSHKALASFMVSRSPLVGLEPWAEIPRLTGVVADFISSLLTLERDVQTDIYSVAEFLETNVINGSISLDTAGGRSEYPEIYFTSKAGRFALHRTSSMVSELAPVILFLKYLVDPGDFLIIEEPESHLHPESQRRFAQCIAKLIRADVNVLITTHSDYFLAQLGNFIRLGQLSAKERVKQGYDKEDYLKADEVGAYLFDTKHDSGGTIVKELPITIEDGIPEEGFAEVNEALYDETVYLQRKTIS